MINLHWPLEALLSLVSCSRSQSVAPPADRVSGWELLSTGGWAGCHRRAAPGVSSVSLWAGQLSCFVPAIEFVFQPSISFVHPLPSTLPPGRQSLVCSPSNASLFPPSTTAHGQPEAVTAGVLDK